MLEENISTLTDFLSDSLGSKYEITVYEIGLSDDAKVIDIRNRHISKQSLNSALPKFISDAIKENHFAKKPYKEFLISSNKEGTIIKTSVLYIKGTNLSDYLLSISSYHNISYDFDGAFNSKEESKLNAQVPAAMKQNVQAHAADNEFSSSMTLDDIIKTKVEEILYDMDITSSNLTFKQKTDIIEKLYEADIFKVKGSVPLAADYLKSSESSVYRYIRQHEIKLMEDNTDNFLM
ncbi:helix-turn-helix domain-containing protein [Sedimentibacter hydroxybenzoicus DSM 7310]|uniref:Helix-turn-helix domain-containing protein n=1 Tax=Sedimentibacter hydroxybenzoicus DSM 7310 TaxID=1123245 RepID=A0A974GXP5_SEDHY|nr:helix-turn-helix domain-containing protein [Sedimentibacter hydroxybenzoicus]NYB75280.1 helix-turn-helix domain-containing protein [Sedimentibacter hydroxybenzoicus DSM 7310]